MTTYISVVGPAFWSALLVRRRVAIMLAAAIASAALLLVRGHSPPELAWSDWSRWVGIGLVVAGLLVRSWAAAVLEKWWTLATTGPYSVCRHPLYVGSTLMVVGFCVLLGDWVTAAILLSAWGITYPATVASEEARLFARFDDTWTRYAAKTPRLVPTRWPRNCGNVSLKTWVHNREYQAVAAALVGVLAVEMVRWLA